MDPCFITKKVSELGDTPPRHMSHGRNPAKLSRLSPLEVQRVSPIFWSDSVDGNQKSRKLTSWGNGSLSHYFQGSNAPSKRWLALGFLFPSPDTTSDDLREGVNFHRIRLALVADKIFFGIPVRQKRKILMFCWESSEFSWWYSICFVLLLGM